MGNPLGGFPSCGTKEKFTEPVALSSPRHIDLPLARSACVTGFDLVALRARCTANLWPRRSQVKQVRSGEVRNLRGFLAAALGRSGRVPPTTIAAMRGGRTYVLAAVLLGTAALLTIAGVGDEPGFPDWQAFVLGVVQGATELLPISSSGHLVLVPWLGDWTYLEQHDDFNHTFDVALHLGTMLAVVGYFFHDLVALVRALVRTLGTRRLETPDERLAWIVLVATIPAGVVGLALEDTITARLGEPWQIAILLAVFAGVLWLVDRRPATREAHDLSLKEGLAVGLAQALALAPGVSRSGITITAGRLFRLDRDAAARLSFLLLVPTVLGAVVLKGLQDVVLGDLPDGWKGPFLVGVLSAWGTGLLAIEWLLGYVRRHTYGLFVVYRLVVAAIIVLLIVAGARSATF